MTLTPGDWIIDRRSGQRLRFSCYRKHNWLGTVAVCLVPGMGGLGRVRQVPLDAIRKAKRRK